MRQEAFQIKQVRDLSTQSLASGVVPSLAMKQVTASRSVDREDAGCNLRVNGLSPEIDASWEADRVQGTGRQQRSSRYRGEAVDTHRGRRRRHVFNDLEGTWENRAVPNGSFQQAEEARRRYGGTVVGLTHIRGVTGVMPGEFRGIGALEGVSSNV